MDFQSLTRILIWVCAIAPAITMAQQPVLDLDAEYSRRGADTCLGCHDDQSTLALFRSKHAVRADAGSPFGHGQLQCEACHGPGGAHSARIRRGQERPPIIESGYVQNTLCLDCHDSDVGSGWHADAHNADDVACSDCHSLHAARDIVMNSSTQPDVCFGCHQLQRAETLRAFAHPFSEGKMGCTGCHSPHDATGGSLFSRASLNDTCYQCHAEKRGPYLWEHEPVAEDCGLCHAPHGSNQPGMLTQRAPFLCQSCHSQSGHPSIAQDASGIATGKPSQFLLGRSCMNCHQQVHGSNHPSGSKLMR